MSENRFKSKSDRVFRFRSHKIVLGLIKLTYCHLNKILVDIYE